MRKQTSETTDIIDTIQDNFSRLMLCGYTRTFHAIMIWNPFTKLLIIEKIKPILQNVFSIVKNNVFEHNKRLFKQKQGTETGSKMAPPYEILFLADLEEMLPSTLLFFILFG